MNLPLIEAYQIYILRKIFQTSNSPFMLIILWLWQIPKIAAISFAMRDGNLDFASISRDIVKTKQLRNYEKFIKHRYYETIKAIVIESC